MIFIGGPLTPFFKNLLFRVKLGYPPNSNFLGKPLLGLKYAEGKKKKKKKNNAKFSGHYVCPRTDTVREHALRSHQFRASVKKLRDKWLENQKGDTETNINFSKKSSREDFIKKILNFRYQVVDLKSYSVSSI